MESKKRRELPEFETIQAAIKGDAEAINHILSYFQPFINSECKLKMDRSEKILCYEQRVGTLWRRFCF